MVTRMHVVLVQPEIAPNTGNIIRLCAITGNELHLVEPLGFKLDDRLLRRGGLDYHETVSLTIHPSLEDVALTLRGRWFAFSSHATRSYADVTFQPDDVIVFGAERDGLSKSHLDQFPTSNRLTIPMRKGSRCLNLANSVAIVSYEAWRQGGFEGSNSEANTQFGLTSETPGAAPFDS